MMQATFVKVNFDIIIMIIIIIMTFINERTD